MGMEKTINALSSDVYYLVVNVMTFATKLYNVEIVTT